MHLQDSGFRIADKIWESSQKQSLTAGLREHGLIRGGKGSGGCSVGGKVTGAEIAIQTGWRPTTKSGVSFVLHTQGKRTAVSW